MAVDSIVTVVIPAALEPIGQLFKIARKSTKLAHRHDIAILGHRYKMTARADIDANGIAVDVCFGNRDRLAPLRTLRSITPLSTIVR